MSKFIKTVDNIWYHHKWMIIIISVFLLVVIICTVQMCQKEEYDFQMMYAGGIVTRSENENAIINAFMTMIPKDKNAKNGFLHSYAILSDDEIKQKKEEAALEGDSIFYDVSLRNDSIAEINTMLRVGEVSLCLISPYVYQVVSQTGKFVSLSETLGYVPDSAYDDFAVYIKKTDFGKYFDAFAVLPEDTLMCVFADSFVSEKFASSKIRAGYELSLDVFKNALSFKLGE